MCNRSANTQAIECRLLGEIYVQPETFEIENRCSPSDRRHCGRSLSCVRFTVRWYLRILIFPGDWREPKDRRVSNLLNPALVSFPGAGRHGSSVRAPMPSLMDWSPRPRKASVLGFLRS